MIARGLIVAVQFLTCLPTPALGEARPDDLARAAPFVPAVGALVGLGVALPLWALQPWGGWLAALAALIAWVVLTGALHLDGLSDTADALGAGHGDPRRTLAVLGDPHIGAFGVVAIVLVIAAKLVLLASPGATAEGLVLVPAWARWGALVWAWALPALKPGLALRFSQGIGWPLIAGWAAVLAAASLLLAPALLAALVIVPLVAAFWRRRLGAINGDCLGAGIETTEVLLLAALAFAA